MKRLYYLGLAALVLGLVFGTPRVAAAAEAGTVAIQTTSIAAGVGVQWGEGTLVYNGKKHPFSLQGLDIVGVGYAQVKAEGTVSNLTKLSDFEGVYVAAEVGAAVGSGPSTVTMKNPHGVTLTLHAVQEGAQLKLAAGGVNVDLKG